MLTAVMSAPDRRGGHVDRGPAAGLVAEHHRGGGGQLWALRYPGQHALHVLERPAGPSQGVADGMHVRSSLSSVRAPDLADTASVVVASERLDGESGWRMLARGNSCTSGPTSASTRSSYSPAPAHPMPLPANNPNLDTNWGLHDHEDLTVCGDCELFVIMV